jgi:hypothetical protein
MHWKHRWEQLNETSSKAINSIKLPRYPKYDDFNSNHAFALPLDYEWSYNLSYSPMVGAFP